MGEGIQAPMTANGMREGMMMDCTPSIWMPRSWALFGMAVVTEPDHKAVSKKLMANMLQWHPPKARLMLLTPPFLRLNCPGAYEHVPCCCSLFGSLSLPLSFFAELLFLRIWLSDLCLIAHVLCVFAAYL